MINNYDDVCKEFYISANGTNINNGRILTCEPISSITPTISATSTSTSTSTSTILLLIA